VLPILDLSKSGPAYFDELGALAKAYPPPSQDADGVPRFARAGIGAGLTPSRNPALVSLLAKAVPGGLARIHAAKLATVVNGWSVNYKITNFIRDPLERAVVNQVGPGAHIAKEALYFSANGGPDGKPLGGHTAYKLTFPGGHLPPVDAFWSLTLYGPDYRLVENPLKRYAINDRTAGLAYGRDGSLSIQIQHAAPAAGQSNWLPAPEGPYKLLFRTYQPRPELYDGTYKLPPLEVASA